MIFNFLNYSFHLGLIILLYQLAVCSTQDTVHGEKEIFDGCNFQGKESINDENVNCTKLPIPSLWDEKANHRCINEYVKGCQFAKIQHFCHLGAIDRLKNESLKCKPLTQDYEVGMEFYALCCDVCSKGKQAYLNKETCKRELAEDADFSQVIMQNEFENCCSSKATKDLRSTSDNDDYLEKNPCDNYKCEHFCEELDSDKAACTCRNGFMLNRDGHKCDDIDECMDSIFNICGPYQKCINLEGSYECVDSISNDNLTSNEMPLELSRRSNKLNDKIIEKSCKKNEYFDPHRNRCIEVVDKYDNFCLDETCNTNTNVILETTKNCGEGQKTNEENGFCEDMDECAVENLCQKDEFCVNRIGSFACLNLNDTKFDCEDGLIKNGQKCVDKDECLDEKVCNEKTCINLLGSYKCVDKPKNESTNVNSSLQSRDSPVDQTMKQIESDQNNCNEGQEKKDGQCVDIDMCARNSTICGENSKCENSFAGNYTCTCNDGYVKDETTKLCVDKDECWTGENICIGSTSTCNNLIGSYECICKAGYKKSNDSRCININECENNDHKCDQICLDKPGTFECKCHEDYYLDDDKKTCVEVDQCRGGKDFCDGICSKIKIEGSFKSNYTCKQCLNGFHLSKDNQKCIAINQCESKTCSSDHSCIDLKNGQHRCINYRCPPNYTENLEDKICYKNETLNDGQPMALSKRAIILPSKYMNETRTIYRFKKPEKTDDVEIDFEISTPKENDNQKNTVDKSFFKLSNQQLSYNLISIKPIQEKLDFIIEISATYKKKKLHTTKLDVFVV